MPAAATPGVSDDRKRLALWIAASAFAFRATTVALATRCAAADLLPDRQPRYFSPMLEPANRLVIALAQIPSIVGDIAGNRDRLREGARGGRRLRRRPRAGAGALPRRLSARGPGAEARLPGGLPRRLRGAGARDGGRRARGAGRPALGRGGQAAQRDGAARPAAGSRRCGSRSTCRTTAYSTRSGCSRPARRRGRSSFAASALACRSARTSGAPTQSNASSRPAARSCSSPTPRPMSATSSRSARTSRCRAWSRAACR